MGSDPNERNGRKGSGKLLSAPTPDFWTFHPKESDKPALRAFCEETPDVLKVLEEETRRGIVFTITRTKQGDSLCVIARNRFDGYGEGQALSVFHSDPFKAIASMAYVLRVLHPAWPAEKAIARQASFDW